jgi:hypothetical protein
VRATLHLTLAEVYMRALTLLISILLAAMLLVGCGSNDEGGSAGTTAQGTAGGQTDDTTGGKQPGLNDLADGRKEAVGVLDHRDLEGGFWAIVQATEGEPTEEAPVVAVLANAEALGVDLEDLQGSYVRAEGSIVDGPSIRMAGPEMEADLLEPAESPAPQQDPSSRSY